MSSPTQSTGIPRLPGFDSTRRFFADGYEFVGRQCRLLGSDAFRTRIMLQPVVCMMGEAAASRFYDGRHFTRNGAMPQTTLRLLQDRGSVQMLDAAAHRARKSLFLSTMTPASVDAMSDGFDAHWRSAWQAAKEQRRLVRLQSFASRVLCAAACDWAGVAVDPRALRARTHEFEAMIDGAGSVGPRNWKGLLLRRRSERWARDEIDRLRGPAADPDAMTPAARIATWRDPGGHALDREVAAVEILNLVRPTVAVARFIVFAALAMHQHPGWRERLRDASDEALEAFAHEVRRLYPFFPVIGGRALEAFEWRGETIEPGQWVLLGLHATNHDPRLWDDPDRFIPERFLDRHRRGNEVVAQGAGAHIDDHRCPGESMTVAIIVRALRLISHLSYRVPSQDLTIPLDRFPTLPASGLVVEPT